MAIGIDRAILLETDGRDWDPSATAAAIVDAIEAERAAGTDYDLLLFGNEAADSGDFQVGIRVAVALGLPFIGGVKSLEIRDGLAVCRREGGAGWEVFELPLPAVVAVREGINLPRYPSVPGRLRAKKKEIVRIVPTAQRGRPDEGPAAASVRAGERRSRSSAPAPRRRPPSSSCSSGWGSSPDDPDLRRARRRTARIARRSKR